MGELRDLGYLACELWDPLVRELRSWRAVIAALRDAGYTAKELHQSVIYAGYKPRYLIKKGCSAEDLIRIGFTTAHLRKNGLVAEANRIDALSRTRIPHDR